MLQRRVKPAVMLLVELADVDTDAVVASQERVEERHVVIENALTDVIKYYIL
jgi:hypothetical protein